MAASAASAAPQGNVSADELMAHFQRMTESAVEIGRQNQAAIQQLVQVQMEATRVQQTVSERRVDLTGKDLVRVLPQPAPFSASSRDDELAKWKQWSWQFEQWLCALDPEFQHDLESLRGQRDPVDMTDMEEQTRRRSVLMYSIMTGLLHERGLQILKPVRDQNGYESYRLINNDLQPNARTRALALLQAINAWPTFDMKHGLTNQLARLEDAQLEYERITNTVLSDDHRMSVLLRCLTGPLKQYTNIAVTEGSNYQQLVTLVKRWESSQIKWSNPINNMYQLGGQSGYHQQDGPTPMEIDRIQDSKGFGKGGKGKGGGKGFGKGKGFDKGKGKGGKGKGSKGSKGKDDHGKGKGKFSNIPQHAQGAPQQQQHQQHGTGSDTCLYCGKRGHWKRDCYQRQRDQASKVHRMEGDLPAQTQDSCHVSQPQQQTPSFPNRPPSSTASNGSASNLTSATQYRSSQSNMSSVRRVCFPLDDGSALYDLTVFELDSNPDLDTCAFARAIQCSSSACEYFDMSAYDSDAEFAGEYDEIFVSPSDVQMSNASDAWWFDNCIDEQQTDSAGQVCMVRNQDSQVPLAADIILDSGADVSGSGFLCPFEAGEVLGCTRE